MSPTTKCRKQSISKSDLNMLEFKRSELKANSRLTTNGDNLVTAPKSEAFACRTLALEFSANVAGDGDSDVLDPRRFLRSDKSSLVGQMQGRFDLMHLSHWEDLSVSSHFFLLFRPDTRKVSAMRIL